MRRVFGGGGEGKEEMRTVEIVEAELKEAEAKAEEEYWYFTRRANHPPMAMCAARAEVSALKKELRKLRGS